MESTSRRFGTGPSGLRRVTEELIHRARAFPPRVDPPEHPGDAVILLHGLGRSRRSLALMERVLRRAGYVVVNRGYPARAGGVEAVAERALEDALAALHRRAGAPARIHFVTHSMGAILLRAWFRGRPLDGFGRAVLLGPPNRGSEIVEALARAGLDEALLGPAGADLGPGEDAAPARLPPLPLPHGVIAGRRSVNPLSGAVFDGPNDGLVSVDSALATGATDRLVLPVTHTLMMNEPMAIWQTGRFLATGAFDHRATHANLRRDPLLT